MRKLFNKSKSYPLRHSPKGSTHFVEDDHDKQPDVSSYYQTSSVLPCKGIDKSVHESTPLNRKSKALKVTTSDPIKAPESSRTLVTLRRASQVCRIKFFALKHILRPVFGISLALMQCLSMAFVFLMVSKVKGVSPLAIGNMRMICQLLISLPLTIFNSDPVLPPKRYALPVLIRCVSGTLGVVSLMFAMSYAPISDASSIIYTSPIFVAILARIFLAERISLIDASLLGFTVFGVLFITRPAIIFNYILPPNEPHAAAIERHYPKHHLGLAFAATSAFTSSVAIVSIRKVRSLPLSLILVDFSVVGILVTTILCFSLKAYTAPSCSNSDRLLLIASSLLGSLGQFFLYGALCFENAGIISATASMGIVFTFILQVVYKGENPPWTSWFGASLVTTSIMALGLHKWLVGRKVKRARAVAAQSLPALPLQPSQGSVSIRSNPRLIRMERGGVDRVNSSIEAGSRYNITKSTHESLPILFNTGAPPKKALSLKSLNLVSAPVDRDPGEDEDNFYGSVIAID